MQTLLKCRQSNGDDLTSSSTSKFSTYLCHLRLHQILGQRYCLSLSEEEVVIAGSICKGTYAETRSLDQLQVYLAPQNLSLAVDGTETKLINISGLKWLLKHRLCSMVTMSWLLADAAFSDHGLYANYSRAIPT